MTDLPPWAVAALAADGLDLEDIPKSVKREWKKLGPLTQEKGAPWWGELHNDAWTAKDLTPIAGYTCGDCPQQERAYSYRERIYSKDGFHEKTVRKYTQRCAECSRKMKRWQRAMTDAEHAQIASICYEQGISFVTLTQPNMVGCPISNTRLFKEHVADFRKKFPEDTVSGGKDHYEWTCHPDDRAWSNPIVFNVHMHGVWVMEFWDQREMQDTWARGIVHIKRAGWRKSKSGRWIKSGDAVRDTVRYCTKYAGKADVKGIRLKEGFGCLYGSAKRALLNAYRVRQEEQSETAGGAQD